MLLRRLQSLQLRSSACRHIAGCRHASRTSQTPGKAAVSSSSDTPGSNQESHEYRYPPSRRLNLRRDQQCVEDDGPAEDRSTSESLQPSLFEQLFPDDTKKLEAEKKAKSTLEASSKKPRSKAFIPQHASWAKEWAEGEASRPPLTTTRPDPPLPLSRRPWTSSPAASAHGRRTTPCVLILSGATKSLLESDFLRLGAKGEHIEGWRTGMIKVIPARSPSTLAFNGSYFVLFSTAAAARAYQDTVSRLHRVAQTNTPISMTSALAPPPGVLKDGEDLHALLQSFTLIPGSYKSVYMTLQEPPLNRSLQKIVNQGGYRSVVERQKICENLVLINLGDGSGMEKYVSVSDIKNWIARDGKARNLAWELFGAGDDDIFRVLVEDEEHNDNARPRDNRSNRSRNNPPSRFIVSFKDMAEARRFVRAWHRRQYPLDLVDEETGQIPQVVNAELLW